jgi:hypothetical protein
MKSDLDPLSTVKVGKLLGASMIVAGAYQKAGGAVRLTARFVKVETGEIVGSAKVDGPAADFLSLQDRVTVELLRSAGLAREAPKFAQRARPKLKSLKPVELYGDAVVETDDKKKEEILKLALNEDPGFVYASRDLDELEKRLRAYDAAANAAQDRALRELRDKLDKETDPQKRAQMAQQVYAGLLTGRRYRTLLAECRKQSDELCAYYVVLSENALKQGDRVLQDGEAFLRRYPSSLYFKSVEGLMQAVINQRRQAEEGKAKVAGELARLGSQQKWDLCHVARIYKWNHQLTEAQRLYRACLEVGTLPRGAVLRELVFADIDLGDFKSARAHYEELRKLDDKDFAAIRQAIELQLPTDG